MTAIVLDPQTLPSKDRGSGIVTVPLVTAGRGSRAMLTGLTTIPAGAAVPLHTHNCEECVTVVAGEGVAHIDGVNHPVAVRHTSWIPAETPHCFRNTGEEPMTIFWVYASIDATRTIIATGKTTRIDEER